VIRKLIKARFILVVSVRSDHGQEIFMYSLFTSYVVSVQSSQGVYTIIIKYSINYYLYYYYIDQEAHDRHALDHLSTDIKSVTGGCQRKSIPRGKYLHTF
jgi:hypothetical protein